MAIVGYHLINIKHVEIKRYSCEIFYTTVSMAAELYKNVPAIQGVSKQPVYSTLVSCRMIPSHLNIEKILGLNMTAL